MLLLSLFSKAQTNYETYVDTGSVDNNVLYTYTAKPAVTPDGDIAMLICLQNASAYDSLYFVVYDKDKNLKNDTVIYIQGMASWNNLSINSFKYSAIDNYYYALVATTGFDFSGYNQEMHVLKISPAGEIAFFKMFTHVAAFPDMQVTMNDLEVLADSSVIIVGHIVDDIGSTFSPRGIILKLDKNGNEVWRKVVSNGVNSMNFSSITRFADNRLAIASVFISYNYAYDSVYYAITTIDTSGTILWQRTYDYDTIPGVYPLEYQTPFITNFANTLVIGFKGDDTLNYNPITFLHQVDTVGNTLNRKQLGTATTPIDIQGLYASGSRLCMMGNAMALFDSNLNILQANSIKSPFGGIVGTGHPSGGFVAVGDYWDDIDGTMKMVWLKADDSLYTHCQDSIFNIPIANYTVVEEPLTYSVTTTGFIKDTVPQLGYSDYTIASLSNMCGCNQTISGVASYGGTPSDSIKIYLYKSLTVPNPFYIVDSLITSSTGSYAFSQVQAANYIVQAKPVPPKYPDAVRTYYSAGIQWPYWDSADVVTMHCVTNPIAQNIDINLIQNVAASHTGPGSLSGYVFEAAGYPGQRRAQNTNQHYQMQPGDPVPGIDITVSVPPPSPPSVVGTTTTDGNGYYSFNNLSLSDTFIVSVDFPGMPNDSVYSVMLTLSNISRDSLNFYIDSEKVYIANNGVITAVTRQINFPEGVKVYPVPASEILYFETSREVDYIECVNVSGQLVFKHNPENNETFSIDVSEFDKGMYFLIIHRQNNIFIRKIMFQ